MSTFVILLIAGVVLAIAELTRSAEGTSGAAKRSESWTMGYACECDDAPCSSEAKDKPAKCARCWRVGGRSSRAAGF